VSVPQGEHKRRRVIEALWVGVAGLALVGAAVGVQPVATTTNNFYNAGTQPGELTGTQGGQNIISPSSCSYCHADYAPEAPWRGWAHSVMGQSARDPVFHAALAIAEQDASFVGQLCLRCHAPSAFLAGNVTFNSTPGSSDYGKANPLSGADLQGISCNFCHRMVDPLNLNPGPNATPALTATYNANATILASLQSGPPASDHNGSYVIDPQDRRRGPYDLNADWGGFFPYHAHLQSTYHLDSRMCATCHDVSSSHFTKQAGGSYTLNAPGQAPAASKYNQFPEQRTFSEWSASLFGQGPVNLAGRFGGNNLAVRSCQDCHMPTTTGQGCALDPPERSDLPQHFFLGANNWVLKAVRALYDDLETGMNESDALDAIARNEAFMAQASDMELSQRGTALNVRVINFSGHKLPTGYNEGRRMWINVKFKNAGGAVIAERGAYDAVTATLTDADTKVYEAKMGPDATVAAAVGTTAGPNFRLAISNKYYKDNRIPPMGFTNAAFNAVQAGYPAPSPYADGQYWDDTPYAIPAGAKSAEVSVYYQVTSKEYAQFLRDANVSNSKGQTLYNQWLAQGQSPPILMDQGTITFVCKCDWNMNGTIDLLDIFGFLTGWFANDPRADFNGTNGVDLLDIFDFLSCWFAGCN
jgi:hypothetical protein